MKEVQIQFALAYTRGEFQETIDALATGAIDATPMITDVINLDQVPAMFTALKRPGTRAKVMVEFAH
jgi:threonine dehydrogenase-like Zn-dependent dehydrogenase